MAGPGPYAEDTGLRQKVSGGLSVEGGVCIDYEIKISGKPGEIPGRKAIGTKAVRLLCQPGC